MLRFKNSESEYLVNQFCEWAGMELLKQGIHVQTIVRALNNNETEPTNKTSLDTLGNKLAQYLNACYVPELLKKSRPTFPLKRIELGKRKMEIDGVYFFEGIQSKNHSILIIDDIYTTGATTNEIVRAIRLTNPNAIVSLFTLGKTEFQSDKNQKVELPDFVYNFESHHSAKMTLI